MENGQRNYVIQNTHIYVNKVSLNSDIYVNSNFKSIITLEY